MNYLFGTAKPKEPEVKVDINAPTLSDTSKQVNFKLYSWNATLDGCTGQSYLSQSWWV